MGGLIAGAYGAGVPLDDITAFAVGTRVLDFASPDRSWRALFDQRKLAPKLAELLGGDELTFEELSIPVAVTAVDLETGELVILDQGPLIPALLATAALPLFFAPVHHQGRWLVDGGVLNNVPFDVARRYDVDRVLAVAITPNQQFELTPNPGHQRSRGLSLGGLLRLNIEGHDWRLPFMIAEAGISLTQQLVNRTRMDVCPPDMLLEVSLPGVGMLSTDGSRAAVDAGYHTALAHLDALKALAAPISPAWHARWRCFRHRARLAWRILHGPAYPMFPEVGE
jgi:NTE family protein